MENKKNALQSFGELLEIMDTLREKCPWDKKQTFQTLRHLTLEEVYELNEALLQENLSEIKKELGDVLLHLVFYAKIASEKKEFDIGEVIQSLNEKLIYRHPHIYGNLKVENEEQVKENWEKLKLKEGNSSVLSGVPKSLPSLIKAYRIQDKVKGVGFDFPTAQDAFEKIKEEIEELEKETDVQRKTQELGDVFFSLINYARTLGINPDEALEKTNQKFINRFQKMEEILKKNQMEFSQLSINQMDKYWQEAKNHEQKN